MTDNEIIKALECCKKAKIKADCEELGCPMFQKGWCAYLLHCDLDSDTTDVLLEGLTTDALDLINRQKAEIEMLREINSLLTEAGQSWQKRYEAAKAEAIKEFAERLMDKAELVRVNAFDSKWAISYEQIDNLVKEMVGDNNGG